MIQFLTNILAILTLHTCTQQVTGVVLNQETKAPIEYIAIGQYEKFDASNPDSKRIYTDKNVQYTYTSTYTAAEPCPDLALYFTRRGYKTTIKTFKPFTENDTLYIETAPFNKDSSITITLQDFDYKVQECISLLQTKPLAEINDEQHIQIMMCLHTIYIARTYGGHYDELLKTKSEKNYERDIIEVYPDYHITTGMGYYFPKIQMQLGGIPSPYTYYKITK